MKKNLFKILTLVIVLCLSIACLVGCNSNWSANDVTLKNLTAEINGQGGFIGETENYIYFINGYGDNTKDNTFGAPVKGALMAADKSDLSKTCIVVPKLFVAGDTDAGVYIFDKYVYYGTPNTDKTSSGSSASSEMTFMRTKLDGSESETFITTGSINDKYRFVKNSTGDVCLVYYNTTDKTLNYYNTVSKNSLIIAQTDEEAENESLDAYLFIDNAQLEDAVVVYTTTVYAEAYDEEDDERSTKAFNRVYAYSVGDTKANDECYGVLVLDGDKAVSEKYSLIDIANGNVVYSKTKSDATETTYNYIVSVSDFHKKAKLESNFINNSNFVSASTGYIVNNFESAYYIDSEDSIIKTTSLVGTKAEITEKTYAIAEVEGASKLLFVNGSYLYLTNEDDEIVRIKITDKSSEKGTEQYKIDRAVQQVSEGSILGWYVPEVIKVGQTDYLFYCDTSSSGLSYIKYVNISADAVGEDTDDDDEDDTWSLQGHQLISIMTDSDKANYVSSLITNFSEKLDDGKFVITVKEDGNVAVSELDKLVEIYNETKKNANVFNNISSSSKETYEKYLSAYEMEVAMYKLYGFTQLDTTAKDALKSTYEQAKAIRDKIFNADTSTNHEDYETMISYLSTNVKYYYDKAEAYFAD